MDKKKLIIILTCLPIILIGLLNLLTVFTPEIGFDALWYHLTLPKLWLLKGRWFFNGGLLYYSVMPRLTELIFSPLIKYTGFIGPKFIQFLSGIGVSAVIWKICSKLKLQYVIKVLSVSLFYCTWLVSWQSGSAYIDLFRTFLESLALYFLVSKSWVKGGLFLGLAVGTKWLALGSVAIYALVFGLPLLIPATLLTLPWMIVAYKFTGNPVYPIFSSVLHQSVIPVWQGVKNVLFLPVTTTIPRDDFLSPMVGVLVLLSTISLFSRRKTIQKIALVGILGSIVSVILDPPSSRFLLPYLPALIIPSVYIVSKLKPSFIKIFIILTIISSFLILSLRIIAIKKYLPFVLGRESQNTFLTSQSSRLPLTFIDSDNFVKDNIPSNSKILIDKLHNLYYFPYNFDHTSWVSSSAGYDYLVTTNSNPSEINGKLIHTNQVGIQIFELSK